MSVFYENANKAYKNNELYELLSGDEKYSKNSDGSYSMAPNPRLMGCDASELDHIDIGAILSGLETVYCGLKRKTGEKDHFIKTMTEVVEKMCSGNDAVEVYYATKVYFDLSRRSERIKLYPLKGLDEKIKPFINNAIENNKDNLSNTKLYEGFEDGLLNVLIRYNDRLDQDKKISALEEK